MASAVLLTLGVILIKAENAIRVHSNGAVDFKNTSTPNLGRSTSTTSSSNNRTTTALKSSRHSQSWRMEKNDGPDIPIEDNVWQPVGGASDKFYVYSAYCSSDKDCGSILIIGATRRLHPDEVLCKVRYPNNITLTGDGKIGIIREHHKLKYAACFIKCHLAVNMNPDSVSIVTKKQMSRPTNHLRVIDTKKCNGSKRMGICVKPLHYIYDKTAQLVEFMELNRILGMEHVTFYNSSISHTTDCILRKYVDEGRATVLPWKDRFKSQKEIMTENIIAALNDCLYRNRHNFTYLAFLDMDEFIIPAHNDTIQQVLETLEAKNHLTHIGSYNFRNGFFYLQWDDDPTTNSSDDVYERNLVTLLKTRRKQQLHPHGCRSKYIVKPMKVEAVGNHVVWDFTKGYIQSNVKLTDGMLNHYRICEFGGNGCISSSPSQVDRTAFRYKDRLVAAVKQRWQSLRRRCGIGEIRRP